MKDIEIENVVKDLKLKQLENIQPYLKNLNISIMNAIKITRKYYNISLNEAKNIVSTNEVWSKEAKDGDKLHQVIMDSLI